MSKKQPKSAPGFWHSRLISIVSISMVLFLIGVVAMMGLIGRDLQNYVRESMSFSVILSPDAPVAEIDAMKSDLSAQVFVKEVIFHSKEEAMAEISKELGDDPESFLGWNPLSPTFEVKVKAPYVASADSIALVEHSLKSFPLTQRLSYRRTLLDTLNNNIKKISIIMLGVAIVLLFISFVLINNTIRLLIYSKRFTIYTMRLVGATSGFIRRPFIGYNMVSGLWASLLAIGFLGWVAYYMVRTYPYLISVLTPINGIIVSIIVIAVGVIISLISSFFAVNKYLGMNVNKLYRV